MRTVANRAQAQRCGRRRPVDTVAGADDHRVQYSSELMTADTKGRGGGASPGSVNRLDRRKARTRAALIEAAQALLAEGRTNAPVNVITEAADLGTGSFYNHFETKEQLFEAAVTDALERHADYVEELTRGLDDPAEVFAQSYRLHRPPAPAAADAEQSRAE